MARQGYGVACVSYRFTTVAPFPAWPHSMDLETNVFARCLWLMRRFLAMQLG